MTLAIPQSQQSALRCTRGNWGEEERSFFPLCTFTGLVYKGEGFEEMKFQPTKERVVSEVLP